MTPTLLQNPTMISMIGGCEKADASKKKVFPGQTIDKDRQFTFSEKIKIKHDLYFKFSFTLI
jgi:hypothetical protein